jgi:hypothetical protein
MFGPVHPSSIRRLHLRLQQFWKGFHVAYQEGHFLNNRQRKVWQATHEIPTVQCGKPVNAHNMG